VTPYVPGGMLGLAPNDDRPIAKERERHIPTGPDVPFQLLCRIERFGLVFSYRCSDEAWSGTSGPAGRDGAKRQGDGMGGSRSTGSEGSIGIKLTWDESKRLVLRSNRISEGFLKI